MLFIRFFKFEFAFIEKIKVIIICASSCFPPSSTFPGRGRRVHPARDQVFQGGGGLYLYRAQAGAVQKRFYPLVLAITSRLNWSPMSHHGINMLVEAWVDRQTPGLWGTTQPAISANVA